LAQHIGEKMRHGRPVAPVYLYLENRDPVA
jgi:hypothetical protein